MKKIIMMFMVGISVNAFAESYGGVRNPDFSHLSQYFNKQFHDIYQEIYKLKQANFKNTGSIQYFDEKTKHYIIKLNTAIAKKNITINATDEYIVIKGSQNIQKNNQQHTDKFTQSISLPNDADINNISAKKEGKLLTISIPQLSNPKPKFQTITVE